VSRLPIRVRLTLAFALAMTVVLAATGALLYLGLRSSLDESIREGLDTRIEDLSAGAAPGPNSDERLTELHRPDRPGRSVLSAEELERVRSGDTVVVERRAAGLDGRTRLLARAINTPEGHRIAVVGASLEDREEALAGLLGQLALFGPAALLLASLLGYAIATAALRPVEAMRAEATVISAAEPGRRLPVPKARDEISRLGATLNEMLERLEHALARERGFVADASHELRTPLARLQGELELALRRPRSQGELEAAIRVASAETDRLSRLAEDLLVLARSDQQGLQLRRETVRIVEVASGVGARHGDSAVTIDVDGRLELSADRARLEQALGNLVENALEHGAEPVEVGADERDGTVDLHVRDGGPGFPADFLPRAFERFSRADAARSGGGAGLGLAIVGAIARAHGGEAHAANRPGGGADVWISLPR
jgi:two-component system, OmpR family, sensor kinase